MINFFSRFPRGPVLVVFAFLAVTFVAGTGTSAAAPIPPPRLPPHIEQLNPFSKGLPELQSKNLAPDIFGRWLKSTPNYNPSIRPPPQIKW